MLHAPVGVLGANAFGLHDDALIRGAAYIMKARLQFLRDAGACLSPFNAFLILLANRTRSRLEESVTSSTSGVSFSDASERIESASCSFRTVAKTW